MTIEVKRLSGSLGAQVHGVDLANLEGDAFQRIHAAFLEHHVLVFRDQKLTPDDQVEFGQRLGRLYVHPIVPHIETHDAVIEIANRGKRQSLTEVWHSDVSFAEEPPLGSALYALEIPEAGGDTLFANQHLAYEGLSKGMKQMLDGMRALHTGALLGAALGQGENWRKHATAHPVVRTHPETGRKALYVSEGFTVAFEDMTREESGPLLRYLTRLATRPDVTYRHRWQVGDLLLWDNRSVQHHAIHDHGDAPRRLHRITIEGDTPR